MRYSTYNKSSLVHHSISSHKILNKINIHIHIKTCDFTFLIDIIYIGTLNSDSRCISISCLIIFAPSYANYHYRTEQEPMGYVAHLRKQFKSINAYNYHN